MEKNIASIDDSILSKTKEQVREEYKEEYGEYPRPLTDEEKKEYGIEE